MHDIAGRVTRLGLCALAVCSAGATAVFSAPSDPPIVAQRTAGEYVIDGRLDEAGWQDAVPIETWYETRPGDNVEPKVANVAYLLFDDRYLYAGFEFADPEPGKIRAPLADRDNVPSSTDYGGVILDASNDARTAQMFLANPRGIQYDAITSDAADEDSAPDFFWESAGAITENGWTLEMRIPFASLRYKESDPEQWGILLYRNWPRDYRYQMFTSRLPRDSNCFICNVRPLTGLAGLPSGSHFVIAPYANANQMSLPAGDLGSPLVDQGAEGEFGLDAKWLPNPNTIFDATLNPDFSQIESDTAQIAANERFALFFPEKRQFFLEGVDLFSTPINAVFTRTFTAPRWGTRATGEVGDVHLHHARRRGPGRRQRHHPRLQLLGLRGAGLRVLRRGRPPAPQLRTVLRQLPGERPRDRRRRPQPRLRPGLPVADQRPGRRYRPGALFTTARRRTGPIWPTSGTGAGSPATPPGLWWNRQTREVGRLRRRPGTSPTTSGPTTASCRRWASARGLPRSAAPSTRRTSRCHACGSSSTTSAPRTATAS